MPPMTDRGNLLSSLWQMIPNLSNEHLETLGLIAALPVTHLPIILTLAEKIAEEYHLDSEPRSEDLTKAAKDFVANIAQVDPHWDRMILERLGDMHPVELYTAFVFVVTQNAVLREKVHPQNLAPTFVAAPGYTGPFQEDDDVTAYREDYSEYPWQPPQS